MKLFEALGCSAVVALFAGALIENAIGAALFGIGLGLFVLSLFSAYLANYLANRVPSSPS